MTKALWTIGLFAFFGSFQQNIAAQTDLIINEIMANPNNGQLPPYEYIELFNNGTEVIKLEEYSIAIGNNTIALPIYRLAPKQFVLLCNEAAFSAFEPYGNVLALDRWYALNNTGATISLVSDDVIMDSVTYSDSWYGSTAKRAGGWSLERINPHIPCNIAANWSASVNPMGGTPCKPNSIVNPNQSPPIEAISTTTEGNKIALAFNVSIQDLQFSIDNFEASPGQGKPTNVHVSTGGDSLYLYFAHDFELNTLYTLQINGILWCSQVIHSQEIELFRQGRLYPNDVVINEVLFNPKDGGVDFVELFNNSAYPINLQNWRLGTRLISSEMLIIQPQQHLALTTDPAVLYRHYPTHTAQYIYSMPSLPSYTNQQGIVTLFSTDQMIDSLYYNASMHQPFLKNVKGISLERQSPERPTNEAGNFKSAATMSGGATPGYKNSAQIPDLSKKNNFFLRSKTVSPDGDSFEDFLEIAYELSETDYMMNVEIYADNGRLINRLIRQQSAGSSGKINWDCRAENGLLVHPGIYIFSIEIYNEKGHREVKRGGFVVTYATVGI